MHKLCEKPVELTALGRRKRCQQRRLSRRHRPGRTNEGGPAASRQLDQVDPAIVRLGRAGGQSEPFEIVTVLTLVSGSGHPATRAASSTGTTWAAYAR